ncbi:MAG: hypothetical protein V3V19_06130 [Cocleimonas sp.]
MNALGNQLASNLFSSGLSNLFHGAGKAIAKSLGSLGSSSAKLNVGVNDNWPSVSLVA